MSEKYEVSIKQDIKKDKLDIITENKKDILNYLEKKFHNKINEVFKITQNEIDELKSYIDSNNKEKIEELIRKNLIEDDIDGKETNEIKEEKNPNLDTLTIGTQSEKIEIIKIAIAGSINEKLKKYNLEDYQINNITIGIVAKILKKGDLENVFSGIGDGATKFIKNIENGDYSKAIDGGKKSIDKIGKLNNILDSNMKELLTLIDENKDNLNILNKLLSNPNAIEGLNSKTDIDNIDKLKGENLTNYLLNLNKKVLSLDNKIAGFENMQSNIVNAISKSPEFLQKATKSFLDFLLKMPFIGEILAGLMGYKSAKKAIEGFGEELKYAKSTNNLISHGKNKKTNSLEITILKDKDLNNLKYKKLKSFFQTCKNEGINYTSNDFWNKLFNKKADSKKEAKLYKLSTEFNKAKITENDFKNNQPKESFYKKLNQLNINVKNTETQTYNKEALNKKKQKLEKKIISKENLSSNNNTSNFDFSKLDEGDLEDLLNDVSITDLLSNDYESKIKAQIGIDSGIDWIDNTFNYDYESINIQIETFRKKIQALGKEKIEKITKKKINNIYLAELIKEDSPIYKEIYKSELSQIKEIEAKLGKQEEIKTIKNSLNNISGEITEIEYNINNETIKVKFDKETQEINISGKNHKISLDMNYNLTNIEKKDGKISLIASVGGIGEKTNKMSLDEFSNFLYELKSNGKIDLKNESGKSVGKIEKI